MKDTELKRMLQAAYQTERSERQRRFVRAHQRRELHASELLIMQLNEIKLRYAAILLILIDFAAFAIRSADAEKIRSIAAFLPFVALLAMVDLGKSQRYGMDELEMTARLSLRMLKALRLVLVGFAGLVSIVTAATLFKLLFHYSIPFALLLTGLPYMLTTSACLALIRKWHAKENIYGCTAIAACVCVCCIMAETLDMYRLAACSRSICCTWIAGAVIWMVREAYIYLRESEELQWSLC